MAILMGNKGDLRQLQMFEGVDDEWIEYERKQAARQDKKRKFCYIYSGTTDEMLVMASGGLVWVAHDTVNNEPFLWSHSSAAAQAVRAAYPQRSYIIGTFKK